MAKVEAPRAAGALAPEVEMTGYVIGEADDFLLADVSRGLRGIALLADQVGAEPTELVGEDWGSVLRVFAGAIENIQKGSVFARKARGRPREA